MPKNLITLDIATAAFDVYQEVYDIQPIQPVQSGAEPRVKGVTQKKTKKSYSAKKILLYQSKNRPKLEWVEKEDKKTGQKILVEQTARDFHCGDHSKQQMASCIMNCPEK